MAAHTDTPVASASSHFPNRFSNGSLLSVRTLLPEYNAVDTVGETSNGHSTATSSFFPNRLSNPSLLSVTTLLPQYSAIDTLTRVGGPRAHEFRYSYPIRQKNPWATLHLHTRDAVPGESKSLQNQPRVPRFWSCDPLTGAVQLDLDSPQNIQYLSITLNGSIILSSHSGGSIPFLKREFIIWDKSTGDPLQSDNTDTTKKKSDTRLVSGQHTFPFSFPFPTTADQPAVASQASDNGSNNSGRPQTRWSRHFTSAPNTSSISAERSQNSDNPHTSLSSEPRRSPVAMPQTFMEKDIKPSVAYDVSVRIVHGKFKTSSKIKMNIAYFPASEPPPLSQKRREAYEAGALVPSPMNDPDGWFTLPTVKTYGMVKIGDTSLHTRVDYTLYIAHPLSYTRGSVIPCFIAIHCDAVEVAHLLPSTASPTVRLLRQAWHPLADYETACPGDLSNVLVPANTSWVHTMVPTSDNTLVTHDVGRAKWWTPSKDIVQSPDTRHLEGEIHLCPDLQPSCSFQSFRIEYAVELLAFRTANFEPEVPPGPVRKGDNVVASKPVDITTLYRQDEPVPTAYSEPPERYFRQLVSPEKGATN